VIGRESSGSRSYESSHPLSRAAVIKELASIFEDLRQFIVANFVVSLYEIKPREVPDNVIPSPSAENLGFMEAERHSNVSTPTGYRSQCTPDEITVRNDIGIEM
jgi:hypothetical protein